MKLLQRILFITLISFLSVHLSATIDGNSGASYEEYDSILDYNSIKIDKKPEFRGGQDALMLYLSQHLQYPTEAVEKQIEGRVIVSFVIDKRGKVTQVQITKGVCDLLDTEAIRVVSEMPKWSAGMVNNRPINVRYHLPIVFTLK